MSKLLNIIAVIAVLFLLFKWNVYFALAAAAGIIVYAAVRGGRKMKLNKANLLYNQGKTDEALAIYEQYVNSGKASIDIRITYANLLIRCGYPEKTVEQMNKILSYSSAALGEKNRESAKLTRSIANFKCGNGDEALSEAKEVFFEDGYKTIDSYCILTYIMIAMYEPTEEAVKLCEEAYDYDEDNRDIIDNLFICYYRLKDYEQAEELADILVRDYPEFVEAYYHGAVMQIRLGNTDKAREYINHTDECKRTYMTTVSEEEIDALKAALENGQKAAEQYLDKLDEETAEKLRAAAQKRINDTETEENTECDDEQETADDEEEY